MEKSAAAEDQTWLKLPLSYNHWANNSPRILRYVWHVYIRQLFTWSLHNIK